MFHTLNLRLEGYPKLEHLCNAHMTEWLLKRDSMGQDPVVFPHGIYAVGFLKLICCMSQTTMIHFLYTLVP